MPINQTLTIEFDNEVYESQLKELWEQAQQKRQAEEAWHNYISNRADDERLCDDFINDEEVMATAI